MYTFSKCLYRFFYAFYTLLFLRIKLVWKHLVFTSLYKHNTLIETKCTPRFHISQCFFVCINVTCNNNNKFGRGSLNIRANIHEDISVVMGKAMIEIDPGVFI